MSQKIKFIKDGQPEIAAQYIARQIQNHTFRGRPVIWFLSGGSSIKVAIPAAKLLPAIPNLTITLIDERYGHPGHKDSNWEQLQADGFHIKNARIEPVLRGGNADQTLADYEQLVGELLNPTYYKIALMGIGADGHTAGILPHSPAAKSKKLVSFYDTPEFQRITLTPRALAMLDEAVVYATGEGKLTALQNLNKDLSVEAQPAQILKKIPRITIYNDLLGDES